MSEWEMVRLGDITAIKTGKLDANASSDDGEYPFFTCSREPLKISSYSYDCECVLVAGNGDLNVKYYKGKFDAYQRTYIVESTNKNSLYVPFLYLFLDNYLITLREQSIGGVIKYIKLGNLTEARIPLPPLEKQQEIAHQLDKITEIIALRKEQIKKLDLLVKAKFVEMFGDLAFNPNNWDTFQLVEICNLKDDIKCGPFGTQLSKDEYQKNGVPIWGIPQVNSNFKKKPTEYLTEKKAKELSAYSTQKGDIVMSRKGNVGTCALYPSNFQAGILHSDALRIRVSQEIANPQFITQQLRQNRAIKTQIEAVSSGAIMAGINVTKLKSIILCLPPLPLQEQFAHYVQTVEETKKEMEEGLEKMEMLYQERMQRWFDPLRPCEGTSP